MLQIFRNNNPFTVIILFILALLLKLQALVHPVAPVLFPHHLLYNSVITGMNVVMCGNAFGYTLLAVVLLFAQGLYLTAITIRHRLFLKPDYIPAFTYLMLTSVLPAFSYFSAPLLVNWLLLGALDIILRFAQPQNPQKHIFNTGFLLGLAALVLFPSVGYVLFFLIVLILLRPLHPGEWVVALLGYSTPVYFYAGILYLMDKLPEMRRWPGIGVSLPTQIRHPFYLVGCIIGVIILLSSGLFILYGQLSRFSISIRRGWGALIAFLIVSMIVAVFTPEREHAAWLGVMPAMALLTAHPLELEKSRRFSNFIFFFFILFVIYCQMTLNK